MNYKVSSISYKLTKFDNSNIKNLLRSFGQPERAQSRATALSIERSLPRLFGQLIRIPPGHIPMEIFMFNREKSLVK